MAPSRSQFRPITREAFFQVQADAMATASEQFEAFVEGLIATGEAQNEADLGHPVAYETTVNGRASDDFSGLKPGSVVEIDFDLGALRADVLRYVMDQLRANAPVKTGRFRDSIVMLVDDAQEADFDVAARSTGAVVFVDTQPYSRKLERRTAGGIFEAVAALAAAQYGNVVNVRFTYRSLVGGAVHDWAQQPSARALAKRVRGGREILHSGWLTRQPAVSVYFR